MADSLFTELKQRNIFKVGIAYLVMAWLVIQITSEAVPALHLPIWVTSLVFYLSIIGFPFSLFFAWAFEITPEGVKRVQDVNHDESISHHAGRKLDFIIIALLVITAGYFIYESRFTSHHEKSDVTETSTKKENKQPEGTSIAVLAFADMSPNNDQEYFSDGISEEILNVLAKIPKLHVTSRSSAFSFKGEKIITSEVAAKLGVKNILEGSVRKAGNRIRVTAQLIEASSDKHLWSETYDKELTVDNIFEIQDEISTAIVQALKAELGLDVKVASREAANVNLDAHNEYLQGRFFVEKRTQEDIDIALLHFDAAIKLAPEYALALMGKAKAHLYSSEFYYGDIQESEAIERAMPAIEKAIILAPESPEVNVIMGLILEANEEREKAISYFEKAIQLNTNYSDAYTSLAFHKGGSPVERLQILKKARQLNPMSISDNDNYARYLILFGRLNEAEKIVKHMLTINAAQYQSYNVLADIRIVQRRQAEAALLSAKAVELTSGLIYNKYIAASLHADIGLQEQAAELMNKTPFDMIKHRFIGNIELYINQTREKFPRNDNDSFGKMARATAELYAGNFYESAKYQNLVTYSCGRSCGQKIFVYFQVGNNEAAQQLLDREKNLLTKAINADMQYYRSVTYIIPIEIKSMEIASLEGDIEKAMMHLKNAMKKKYILSFEYKFNPMYKKLRDHKDWPSILAESDKLAEEQRKIYQKIVLEDTDITL